jgi:hypothetical protein
MASDEISRVAARITWRGGAGEAPPSAARGDPAAPPAGWAAAQALAARHISASKARPVGSRPVALIYLLVAGWRVTARAGAGQRGSIRA